MPFFQPVHLAPPMHPLVVNMRVFSAILAFTCLSAQAATLEKLSLDEVIAKSTAIVRGKVASSSTKQHGQTIYTHYRIDVSELLKGDASAAADIVVAGGQLGRQRQTYPGSPALEPGVEYVFCLWTGKKSGLTHIIGLTQGLFSVTKDSAGQAVLARSASTETVIDPATGREVADQGYKMQFAEFSRRVKLRTALE